MFRSDDRTSEVGIRLRRCLAQNFECGTSTSNFEFRSSTQEIEYRNFTSDFERRRWVPKMNHQSLQSNFGVQWSNIELRSWTSDFNVRSWNISAKSAFGIERIRFEPRWKLVWTLTGKTTCFPRCLESVWFQFFQRQPPLIFCTSSWSSLPTIFSCTTNLLRHLSPSPRKIFLYFWNSMKTSGFVQKLTAHRTWNPSPYQISKISDVCEQNSADDFSESQTKRQDWEQPQNWTPRCVWNREGRQHCASNAHLRHRAEQELVSVPEHDKRQTRGGQIHHSVWLSKTCHLSRRSLQRMLETFPSTEHGVSICCLREFQLLHAPFHAYLQVPKRLLNVCSTYQNLSPWLQSTTTWTKPQTTYARREKRVVRRAGSCTVLLPFLDVQRKSQVSPQVQFLLSCPV